jgi:hypothetical protein
VTSATGRAGHGVGDRAESSPQIDRTRFLAALLLALLPAGANFLGSLAAEAVPVSQRILSWALHAAAGVVLGVVAGELLPEALHQEPEWLIIVAFVAGGLSFIALDKAIDLVRTRIGGVTAASWRSTPRSQSTCSATHRQSRLRSVMLVVVRRQRCG